MRRTSLYLGSINKSAYFQFKELSKNGSDFIDTDFLMNTCPLLIHKTEGTTIADITNTITSNIIKINLLNPLKLAEFFFANEAEVVVFVNLVNKFPAFVKGVCIKESDSVKETPLTQAGNYYC